MQSTFHARRDALLSCVAAQNEFGFYVYMSDLIVVLHIFDVFEETG